jgi:uncharacterized protein
MEHTMATRPLPEFQQIQLAFAGHLRDPEQPAPPEIPKQRMAIYRELFLNNLEGLLANNFPVVRQTLSESLWQALVRRFLREHHSQTPLFHEIGQELLQYLQQHREELADYPDFLLELAHYEWVETEVALSEGDLHLPPHDPYGDLLTGVPLLSPLARLLSYRYPVHCIGPTAQPEAPPPEPTRLLVYRDRQDRVHFLELNAVTFQLLQRLDLNPSASGQQLLAYLAQQLRHPHPKQLIAQGSALLTDLRQRHILLGTRL